MRPGSRCHYTLNHCSSPKQFYCIISYKFSLLKDPLCSSSEIGLLSGLQGFLPLKGFTKPKPRTGCSCRRPSHLGFLQYSVLKSLFPFFYRGWGFNIETCCAIQLSYTPNPRDLLKGQYNYDRPNEINLLCVYSLFLAMVSLKNCPWTHSNPPASGVGLKCGLGEDAYSGLTFLLFFKSLFSIFWEFHTCIECVLTVYLPIPSYHPWIFSPQFHTYLI